MVRGLCQSSCVKHFSIIHGLNFFFCSGFILQMKWVGNFVDLSLFFFSFTFSASSNVITITIRTLGIVFTFINLMICSSTFSAYLCLTTSGFGVTILIAIVADHRTVMERVDYGLCAFARDIQIVG